MKFNLIYKHTYIKTRQVHVTKHTEPYLEMDKSPRCEGAFLIHMHRCGPARVRAVDVQHHVDEQDSSHVCSLHHELSLRSPQNKHEIQFTINIL